MNQIRAIQALNKREIENGVPPEASWHTDYRDTAFVNFGGLPYELSEGDVITIFSQFGEPVFLRKRAGPRASAGSSTRTSAAPTWPSTTSAARRSGGA